MEMTATATLRAAGKWQQRKVTRVKNRVRTTVIARERRHVGVRNRLASQHLRGSGLEIGGLHMPLRVPGHASVQYVDRYTVAQLREHYPELDGCDLVTPDIIDDGETLAGLPDQSVDFVIANHMIEHCEDPIGTLENHLRVLRPGGVIYMAVPDCRFTFDRDREITPLDHVCRDHVEGPAWSRREHYEQWARFVDRVPPGEVVTRAVELERRDYSIHYHVWTPGAFLEMLCACNTEFGLPFDVDGLERNNHEFIVVLSRG
ncbi:MAG: methyltransferase domain-containing protein [Solirubrobacteraceae bacterium]